MSNIPLKGSPPPKKRPPPKRGETPDFIRGVVKDRGQRIVLYGESGAGKTMLAAKLPDPLFIDYEAGTSDMDVIRSVPDSYEQTRSLFKTDLSQFKSIILDSATVFEQMVRSYVLRTVPTESGKIAKHLEDYGWGKGYVHVHSAFQRVLGDLERQATAGRHVCLICHAEATKVPNPQGLDWLRWEPQLFTRGGANIRNSVLQWADHVLFLAKDVTVDKTGKAVGSGRVLHSASDATMIAKSRRIARQQSVAPGDRRPWKEIIHA